jgi:DNA ligase (NAD+)
MSYYVPEDDDELENLVIHLANLYDQGEDPVDFDGEEVSDPHYDLLVRRLSERRPTSKAFAPGTTSPSGANAPEEEGTLVEHKPPMTSIAKADTEKKLEIYEDWLKRCRKEIGADVEFAQSWKLDGVALRAYYVKGKLVKAGMRPRKGTAGTDVTLNTKYVEGIPQKLPLPLTLAIGGEVICTKENFAKVQAKLAEDGEELRKNERNHTFGALRQLKDPKKTKEGLLTFVAYNITGFNEYQEYYKTEVERAKWANTVLLEGKNFVQVRPHRFEDLAKMEETAPTLKYKVDGVILKVDDLEAQEQLGHHGDDPIKEPHGALAWKFSAEQAEAIVADIVFEASRTGRIPLVAIFDGVQLAGTTVRRATCSNIGWAERMGIGIGAKILVEKAGEIIPKIKQVLSGHVWQIPIPKFCPSCSGPVVIKITEGDKKDLKCENEDCPAKHINGIVHYLTLMDCKGLGASSVELLTRNGKVKELADLYTLTVEDCVNSGFSARESLLALATIHKVKPSKDDHKLTVNIMDVKGRKKVAPAAQFFAALGISGAGRSVGKALVERYKDFDKIREASIQELQDIEGIGSITAEAVYAFLSKNKEKIDRLLKHVELELPKTGKYSGFNFCLSGSFTEGKDHWEKLIQEHGGNIQSSVGRKTNFLVAGEGSGSKSDKAKELGVPILTVQELEKML